MTELDELEETDFNPRHDGKVSANRIRAGKNSATRLLANYRAKPAWVRQLRAIKGRAASQKLKAKVT